MQTQFTTNELLDTFTRPLTKAHLEKLRVFIERMLDKKNQDAAHPLTLLNEKLQHGKQILLLAKKRVLTIDANLFNALNSCIQDLEQVLEELILIDECSRKKVLHYLCDWLNGTHIPAVSLYSIFNQWCHFSDEQLLYEFSSDRIQQVRAEVLNKSLHFNQLWQQLISFLKQSQ